MALHVLRVGVREDMRTELEKFLVGGISAIGGFGISEFTGEFIVKSTKISKAWQKLVVRMFTRIGFGLLFAGLSWMTGGILAWVFFAMAMGAVGGIAMDLIEYFHPGGVKGLAEMMALGSAGSEYEYEQFEPKFEMPEVNIEPSNTESETKAEAEVEVLPAEVTTNEKKAVSLYA